MSLFCLYLKTHLIVRNSNNFWILIHLGGWRKQKSRIQLDNLDSLRQLKQEISQRSGQKENQNKYFHQSQRLHFRWFQHHYHQSSLKYSHLKRKLRVNKSKMTLTKKIIKILSEIIKILLLIHLKKILFYQNKLKICVCFTAYKLQKYY